jgi:6-pyruvoyl-tetrahydropterin synthase-like protein
MSRDNSTDNSYSRSPEPNRVSKDLNACSQTHPSRPFTRKDALLLSGLMLVAIASTLPFAYAAQGDMPQAGDLIVHWPRMVMFDETLRSGVWYPRWLGGMNYGYGAATTIFYAPFVYYALSGAHALVGDWPRSIEAVTSLAAMGSAAAFYLYARSLMSRPSSAVASLLYALLPYHLIDLYHRGALAELIAFVWMPLVMLMLSRSVARLRASSIVAGAIAFALLLITHPPVAYVFSVSLTIFAATLAVRSKSFRPALAGGAIVLLGSALSAFYWLPAVVEVGFVNQSITDLYDRNKGYLTSLLGGSGFEKLIAATIILTGLLFLIFAAIARNKNLVNRERSSLTQISEGWIAAGVASIFMMLPLADPLARLMPGISGMAFVWRWLAITSLAASWLAGNAFEKFYARRQLNKKEFDETGSPRREASPDFNRARMQEALVIILTIGVVIFGAISCSRASNLKRRFVEPAEFVEQDFTPTGSPGVYELPKDISLQMVANPSSNRASLIEWKPEERMIEVSCLASDTLRVYTFMFPGWEAFIDGSPAPIKTDDVLKTMLIDVPQGSHTVRLAFANTALRSRAQTLSLIALSACALIIIVNRLTAFLKHFHIIQA